MKLQLQVGKLQDPMWERLDSLPFRHRRAWCGLALLLGIVWAVVMKVAFPAPQRALDFHALPHWAAVSMRLLQAAFRWPWLVLTCGVLLLIIVLAEFKPRVWILAFSLGGTVAWAVLKALS